VSDKRLLMDKIIIAIDGYSGTGKSSTAKMVAEKLSYTYIDSGAMYRAITLYLINEGINLQDFLEVEEAIKACELSFDKNGIILNGEEVEGQIRTMQVSSQVSIVSAISAVRKKLVEEQRKMSQMKGVVMDGRDIGTVVFPDAELKIFMTTDMDIRVARRQKELADKNMYESEEAIRHNLSERDRIDTSREDSPLRKAKGAIEINTSNLTLSEQVDKIVLLARKYTSK